MARLLFVVVDLAFITPTHAEKPVLLLLSGLIPPIGNADGLSEGPGRSERSVIPCCLQIPFMSATCLSRQNDALAHISENLAVFKILARVSILGSNHTCADVVQKLKTIAPSHVCVELCRDRHSSLMHNKSGAVDMKSVMNYSHKFNTPIHCIDQSIYVTASKLRASLHKRAQNDLLKYVFFHSALERMALPLLYGRLYFATRGMKLAIFDKFICNWLLTPEKLATATETAINTGSTYEAIKVLSVTTESSENTDNPFFSTTPRGYHLLCDHHQLHDILFKTIITDRDKFMAQAIIKVAKQTTGQIAVVVGENHVAGITANLQEGDLIDSADDSFYPTLTDWVQLKILEKLLL